MTEGNHSPTGTLTVSISAGSAIPPEARSNIDAAVHSAVLRSLASIDLGPGFRVADLDPAGGDAGDTGHGNALVAPNTSDVHYGIFIQVNF
jgi:hypothetical protein